MADERLIKDSSPGPAGSATLSATGCSAARSRATSWACRPSPWPSRARSACRTPGTPCLRCSSSSTLLRPRSLLPQRSWRDHPEPRRAENASQVHFNIETKLNPRRDLAGRTVGPEVFADSLAGLIERNRLAERAPIQSFDYRTCCACRASTGDSHPRRCSATFRALAVRPRRRPGSDDGTNLQGEDGGNTLAGRPVLAVSRHCSQCKAAGADQWGH